MNQMTPTLRSLARDLIVYETSGRRPSEVNVRVAFSAVEKLRPHLANLMGKGGFRALLARTMALASAEVSWLNRITLNPDGTFEGLEVAHAQTDPAEFLEGRVVVLAQLLGLLVALIGADLTARLVEEVWPQLRTISPSADSEVKNEKAT